MGIFSQIADQLTERGHTAQAAADKPKLARNPMMTAKQKLVRRLSDSIEMANANDNDAKKSCYTLKGGQAIVGAKYGNAYLADNDGDKFIVVSNEPKQIVTALKTLINAVEQGLFDEELGKAVEREQQRSKARYAKRNASAEHHADSGNAGNANAEPLVPTDDDVEAYANR